MTRWIVVSGAGPASPSRAVRHGARRVIENVRGRLTELQGGRLGKADGALRPAPENGLEAEPQAWCSIVLAQTQNSAEFHAVVLEAGGRRSLVARSEPFRVSRRWAAGARGAPRDEHDALVARLEELGWRRVRTAGRWHDTALVLRASAPPPDTRSATPLRTAAEHNARAAWTPREPGDESAVRPKRAGRRSPAPKREASQSGARKAPATRASATSDAPPRKTLRATNGPAAPSAWQPTVYIDTPQERGRASADDTSGAAQDVPRSATRASDPFRFRAHGERHQAPRRN
jgi:hypothetical protein